LVLAGRLLRPEQRRQTFEDGGFPVGEELRFDVVPAAEFGLAGGTGQQVEHDARRTDADEA